MLRRAKHSKIEVVAPKEEEEDRILSDPRVCVCVCDAVAARINFNESSSE
jgi:hypothetical protein